MNSLKHLKSFLTEQRQTGRINPFVAKLWSMFSNRREAIYLGNRRALTRTIWGHKMIVNTQDVSLTPHLLLDGYWELWITEFLLNRVKPDTVMIEIGANMGYYTMLVAARLGEQGKLYAFEANAEMCELTFRNLEINGLLDRVQVLNKAVCSQNQKVKLSQFKYHMGGSTLLSFPEQIAEGWHDQVEYVEVDGVSLDEFFGKTSPKVDLIKIDAEGSEAMIFKGMKHLLAANPQIEIIFEFLPRSIQVGGDDPESFLKSIEEQGFNLYEISGSRKLVRRRPVDLAQVVSCEIFATRKSPAELGVPEFKA
jgi:FkbM family methyltransferase